MTRARRHVEKMRRRIAAAVDAGQVERARRLRRQMLRSFDARMLAVAYAAKKTRTRMSHEDMDRAARHLNPWRGSRDIVVAGHTPKADGSYRTHYSFGLEHRALQYLARAAMLPGCPGADWNYMAAGRGRDECVERVARDIARNRYLVVADVKGCYDSIQESGATRTLPIPERVTRNVVFGGTLGVGHSPTRRRRRSRRAYSRSRWSCDRRSSYMGGSIDNPPGLVQGSACSDAAMAWLMVPLAEATDGNVRVYGDDIVVPARTLREARAIEQALSRALEAHPAGRLEAKRMRICRREEGFVFLGYHIRRRRGRTTIAPAPRKMELIPFKWYDALVGDIAAGRAEPVEVERVLRRWRNGYRVWANGDRWLERMLYRACRHLLAFNSDMPNVRAGRRA